MLPFFNCKSAPPPPTDFAPLLAPVLCPPNNQNNASSPLPIVALPKCLG